MYEYSYYVTYILLLTTGTITFIEAMRTKSQTVRNIFNLETCISIVAAYFYGTFVAYLENGKREQINTLRYVDWAVTTPMMLITLILTMVHNTGVFIHLKDILSILTLNYGMLLSGYLGEVGIINHLVGNLIGFLFFGGIFTYIYKKYMSTSSLASMALFIAYVIIWSLYGVAYFFAPDEKALTYNVLDLTAKCLVGIFLWCYFAKVIRL
jgi:bacteriorhodopsin